MTILRAPFVCTRGRQLELLLLVAMVGYVLLAAFLPGNAAGFARCPAHYWLGLNCPGCGLTRAGIRLVSLDPVGATLENPLWLVVVPFVAYRIAYLLTGICTGRRLVDRWPRPLVSLLEYVFIATWLVLAVVRIASWVDPGLNPRGLLLPY